MKVSAVDDLLVFLETWAVENPATGQKTEAIQWHVATLISEVNDLMEGHYQ